MTQKNAGGAGRRRPQGKAQGTPTLDSLARDLTKLARDKTLRSSSGSSKRSETIDSNPKPPDQKQPCFSRGTGGW